MKKELPITILVSIAIFILLIITPILFFSQNIAITKSISLKYGSAERLGNNATTLNANVISYLRGDEELQGFTDSEKSHMQDVKKLIDIAKILFLISLAIIIAAIIALKKKTKETFRKASKYSSITTLAISAIITILTLADFGETFYSSHTLLFPQGNWLFPASSLLIQLYPEQFFMEMGLWIFATTILLSIIIFIISTKQKSKASK